VDERPWKERDQSTGSPLEFMSGAEGVGVPGRGAMLAIVGGGSSERPFLRERMFDWDVMSFLGAGFVGVEPRTGTAALAWVGVGDAVVDVDVDGAGGVEDEAEDEVVFLVEEVGVDVRVVGLARLTAAAACAIDVFEMLRVPYLGFERERRWRLRDDDVRDDINSPLQAAPAVKKFIIDSTI
jgi:hypothetical protein